jgi:hypothetical protein
LGVLFALVFLCILDPIVTTHPTCVFLSLANDTHIIGLGLDMVPIFLRLQEELGTLKLLVQPTEFVIWSPHGLD